MNPDSRPEHLTPERVEWIPSSPEQIEVRVSGAWRGASAPPRCVLVIGPSRFEALADAETLVPPAWATRFLVPAEVRGAIESGTALLDVADASLTLPAGAPGR
ncbi:MAG TPA: hypothetical protein VN238_20315, partial [Solirubrobacteraceae bacterium]|nr:hypothetical protein [Solirubrobacteraceae bacterium]